MLITEETLGINPANVASKYTVEIKLVHDIRNSGMSLLYMIM